MEGNFYGVKLTTNLMKTCHSDLQLIHFSKRGSPVYYKQANLNVKLLELQNKNFCYQSPCVTNVSDGIGLRLANYEVR